VTSLTVKTVRKSDKRFELQNILNFQIFVFNMMTSILLSFFILVLIKHLDYFSRAYMTFVLRAQGSIRAGASLLVENVSSINAFI
jgi:hypothetical protein